MVRDNRIDNAKGMLILLVVFGHLMERCVGWENTYATPILYFIYIFHMPMFAMVCGMTYKDEGAFKRCAILFIIYATAEIIYSTPEVIEKGNLAYNLQVPYWILWFLVSLISWTILYRLLNKLRVLLVFSVGLSLIVGLMPFTGHYYSYMRTFIFFPFFILGAQSIRSELVFVGWKRAVSTVVGVVLTSACVIVLLKHGVDKRFLFASYNYYQLKVDWLYGISVRMLLMLTSSTVSLLFFYAVSKKQSLFTRFGVASLSVFIIHWWVITKSEGVIKVIVSGMNPSISLLFLFILAMVIVYLLSFKAINDDIRLYAGSLVKLLSGRRVVKK